MKSGDYTEFARYLSEREGGDVSDGEREELLRFLGVEFLITPEREEANGARAYCVASPSSRELAAHWPMSVALWRLTGASDRVRILHEEFDPNLSYRDGFAARCKARSIPGEKVSITGYDAGKITLDVTLREPGYLLCAEQYWPGWQARVQPSAGAIGTGEDQAAGAIGGGKDFGGTDAFEVPITKDCFFLRRIDLPAGDFTVTMEYHPKSLTFGLAISVTTLFLTAFLTFARRLRSRRKESFLGSFDS